MNSAIISTVNQYLGINAHFQSLALSYGNGGLWREFHRSHITDLTRALNLELEPRGYIAHQEDSLQIGFFPDDYKPESDVLTRDVARQVRPPEGARASASVIALPAEMLLDTDETRIKAPAAIKIYRIEDDEAGLPVTWIELLSPSNKTGQGSESYRAKRDAILQLGIVFVEVDYLHGISTSLRTILDYHTPGRKSEPASDAYPYHIWMIDPRLPRHDEASAALASFKVDDPIPQFDIPLSGQERVRFDFNVVYHQTFRLQPGFGRRVDYSKPPVDALTDYNVRDQFAIAVRMLTVQALAGEGSDLRAGPFPVNQAIVVRLEASPAEVQTALSF